MSDISIDQNNQAREAERAVLGGLMLETHRFDTVIQVITETDFQAKIIKLYLNPCQSLSMKISH